MVPPLESAEPNRNVTVHASAGTGKTWLLVTRIVRLLLMGARPEGILALTFTRKAAAEMETRVIQRLHELVQANDTSLAEQLSVMGLAPSEELFSAARQLYEQLLFCEHPLRTTTFHAFCQDLLKRFPLEASVPPGFDLLESTGSIEQEALDALFFEATQDNAGALAIALEQLFTGCNGISNTRQALVGFLSHRSDWWAYTAGKDPLGFATKNLSTLMDINPAEEPTDGFFSPERCRQLEEFADLLQHHATNTNKGHVQLITEALNDKHSITERLDHVRKVFLKTDGEQRARKPNATQARKMGEQGQQRFLDLHDIWCSALLALQDKLLRRNTWRLSRAWFIAGNRLLEHYQRLKRELRLLDFTDLEWHTYLLLTHSGNAHWVQYKLDARIDHLLIDEFQDTNPTQWQLILPVLEELAAAESERNRSVFLVGDTKQSIYRFRRANAALLGAASDWMQDHLDAHRYTLEASYRSAQTIIDCVNHVFSAPILQSLIPDFQPHKTHRDTLWGQVELSPLIESPGLQEQSPGTGLRDPLKQPRQIPEDLRRQEEARWITSRIKRLTESETLIDLPEQARQVQFGDIVILLRSRTHAHVYENALREQDIPFMGAGKGTLLESLEVRDLEALLNVLIAPYNNLALAQVLRSPLFSASNNDLITLAQGKSEPWILRLQHLATKLPEQSALFRANNLITEWRELAGQLPVHDLLDHIYHSANILERYRCAYPAPLRPRVLANLTRFIELALDVDSGRYPSLPRFLNRLQGLRDTDPDGHDETPPLSSQESRVRVMTIHGAKGLEAPVVFLADIAAPLPRHRAYSALMEWPASAQRPEYFLLTGPKPERDSVSAALLKQQEQPELREEANLLYVALTRAKQLLFLSGSTARNKRDTGWYHIICDQLVAAGAEQKDHNLILRSGTAPREAVITASPPARDLLPELGLSKPVKVLQRTREIAPSQQVDLSETSGSNSPEARQRGIAIHFMLERLTSCREADSERLFMQAAQHLQRATDDPDLRGWWQEALDVWRAPCFTHLFSAENYLRARNEVTIQYLVDETIVHGIIDRLVEYEQEALIIDYKSHRHANRDNVQQLAQDYGQQLHLYAEGVRQIWPHKTIKTGVLFTACKELVSLG